MKHNKMKSKLHAGEPAFGLSIMVPSPQLVEMAGGLGFDWVLLDCEHGTISIEGLELMIMAAEAAGLTPIARPQSKRPDHILQVLDRGAMGVQVPHVNNRADAEAAFAAVKYHPLGERGHASGTRAAGYDLTMSPSDYTAMANDETLVCVQLETAEAIANADEILSVDGIDVFFIGPTDLAQSMGFPGQLDAEPVAQAIESTLAKIVAAGRIPGMPGNRQTVRSVLDTGARYVYAHVPKLLKSAAADYFAAAKDR